MPSAASWAPIWTSSRSATATCASRTRTRRSSKATSPHSSSIDGHEMLRNSALFLLSLVASLGLAEVVVQAFVPVRDVGPSFTVYDPVLGKRLKASFSAERITPEFRMRLSTNSLGFRGPEPKAISSGPILFLGDSFTMGYGVRDGEEYPARVATELR